MVPPSAFFCVAKPALSAAAEAEVAGELLSLKRPASAPTT
jgi:hypothetical protein